MASLIVPKWMRSEFRSDIITRPRGYLAPIHNKLRPLGYKSLLRQPESEECTNCLKTAACQIDPTVLLQASFLPPTAGLKISLPTSNKNRA